MIDLRAEEIRRARETSSRIRLHRAGRPSILGDMRIEVEELESMNPVEERRIRRGTDQRNRP